MGCISTCLLPSLLLGKGERITGFGSRRAGRAVAQRRNNAAMRGEAVEDDGWERMGLEV